MRSCTTSSPPRAQVGSVDPDVVAVANPHQLNLDKSQSPMSLTAILTGGDRSVETTKISMRYPTKAAARNDTGSGCDIIPVRWIIRRMTEQPLHLKGRISPNHHQRAVRHVDNAHQTKRNRPVPNAIRMRTDPSESPRNILLTLPTKPWVAVNLVNGVLIRNGVLIDTQCLYISRFKVFNVRSFLKVRQGFDLYHQFYQTSPATGGVRAGSSSPPTHGQFQDVRPDLVLEGSGLGE